LKSVTILPTVEGGVPLLVEAREVIAAFQAMIRKKSLVDLDLWLERARPSLVTSFANGVAKDRPAVSTAITLPWSNGQTEGQITKLKLVKRQLRPTRPDGGKTRRMSLTSFGAAAKKALRVTLELPYATLVK
jgi:transposase